MTDLRWSLALILITAVGSPTVIHLQHDIDISAHVTDHNGAVAIASRLSALHLPPPTPDTLRCFNAYARLPRRNAFFSRIQRPAGMPQKVRARI